MDIEIVGDSDWKERVLNADRPVLVEFWSPTCAVCKAMEPRLKLVVEDFWDRVDFFKVDVTEDADLVWAYDVMSTPTFIAYAGSEPVGSLTGEVDRTEFINLLEDAIAGE